MSFPEVNKLRKAGQIEEAYNLAQKELNSDPDNIWKKRSMAWVLIMYLKQYTYSSENQKFLQTLSEFKDLKMPYNEDEAMIFDNLKCWIAKFLSQLAKEDNPDTDNFEEFWEYIKEIPYPKPSEMHSSILRFFLKLKDKWNKIEDFLDWWDFNHFRKEDYEPLVMEERTIMPLIEQAYLALAKSILKGESKNPLEYKKTINQEKLDRVLKEMQALYQEHPEYEYFPYYIGLLLSAKGDHTKALGELLPFAREHTGRFWVWTLLGDIHKSDKDLQMACYCRGLLCKEREKSLVRLRQKLAEILVEKEWYPKAKYEINKLKETREQEGWKIPNKIKNWMNHEWYANAELLKNNLGFYKQHATKANGILAMDLDSMVGVVTNVKKDKKVLGFIVNKEISGGFNFSNIMNDRPQPGDKLEMWYEPRTNKEGRSFRKIFHAELTDKEPETELVKDLQGQVKILNNRNIGFLEGAFIPSVIVNKHQLKNEEQIQAKAVLSYNKVREEWGWRVVRIY